MARVAQRRATRSQVEDNANSPSASMRQDRLNSKDQTAELPSVVEVAAALAELYSQPTPHSLSTAAEAGAESSHGGSTSIALPASLPSRQKRAPSDIEHWGWVDPAGQAPNINNSSTTPSQRRALLLPSRSNLVNVCRSDATGAMRVYESAVHLAAFLEDRFSNSLAPLVACVVLAAALQRASSSSPYGGGRVLGGFWSSERVSASSVYRSPAAAA